MADVTHNSQATSEPPETDYEENNMASLPSNVTGDTQTINHPSENGYAETSTESLASALCGNLASGEHLSIIGNMSIGNIL